MGSDPGRSESESRGRLARELQLRSHQGAGWGDTASSSRRSDGWPLGERICATCNAHLPPRNKPCVVWFTGLSGAGKSTIAGVLKQRLQALGAHAYLLDGDNIRSGLSKDLGFTHADRVENVRRVAEVSKLMANAGLIVLVSLISPFRADRRSARALLACVDFLEVFVDTPLAVAEARDPKGLYKRARAGLLSNFTGIDSPYEPPEAPNVRIDTVATNPPSAAELLVQALTRMQVIHV